MIKAELPCPTIILIYHCATRSGHTRSHSKLHCGLFPPLTAPG
jgi:hypothetical protein